MIRCGLSVNVNGQWEEVQLSKELQDVISKYCSNFEGGTDGLVPTRPASCRPSSRSSRRRGALPIPGLGPALSSIPSTSAQPSDENVAHDASSIDPLHIALPILDRNGKGVESDTSESYDTNKTSDSLETDSMSEKSELKDNDSGDLEADEDMDDCDNEDFEVDEDMDDCDNEDLETVKDSQGEK